MQQKTSKDYVERGIIVVLLLALLVLVGTFIRTADNLNGTARIVNYTGIVRGATQRLIKLEVVGEKSNEIIEYLNSIIYGLQNGSEEHNLIKMEDEDFQKNVYELNSLWDILTEEIYISRENGYLETSLVPLSEEYFHLANKTVSSAEKYSQKQANKLKNIELMSLGVIALLIIYIIIKVFESVKNDAINNELKEKAYIDLHTKLPNKSKCDELLEVKNKVTSPTAIIVFDLNYLKQVNETLGYMVGDAWIENFANIIRTAIPTKDFVGRYGGDEFVAVIYNTDKKQIEDIITNINNGIKRFNEAETLYDLSYSYGYEISTKYTDCTMEMLLSRAQSHMHRNKQDHHSKQKKLNIYYR